MSELLQFVGLMAILFAGSMGVAYLATSLKRGRSLCLDIHEGHSVRVLMPGGAYRCRFVRQDRNGLVLSAPMEQDRFVPVHAGESVMVQAPQGDSLLCFRSDILGRDGTLHEFTVAKPSTIKRIERRGEKRDKSYAGSKAKLNGVSADMMDLSTMGAKVVTPAIVIAGDAVTLELPMGLGSVEGWALAARPAAFEGKPAREVRIKFMVPVPGMVPEKARQK
jgi:hypothetical protein